MTTEKELLERAANERREREARDAQWILRKKKRHNLIAICGGMAAIVLYGVGAIAGKVSFEAWILMGLLGALGSFLISRLELGILSSGFTFGACLVLATSISVALGWWNINPVQALMSTLCLGIALLTAGFIALHIDGSDP